MKELSYLSGTMDIKYVKPAHIAKVMFYQYG